MTPFGFRRRPPAAPELAACPVSEHPGWTRDWRHRPETGFGSDSPVWVTTDELLTEGPISWCHQTDATTERAAPECDAACACHDPVVFGHDPQCELSYIGLRITKGA